MDEFKIFKELASILDRIKTLEDCSERMPLKDKMIFIIEHLNTREIEVLLRYYDAFETYNDEVLHKDFIKSIREITVNNAIDNILT